MTNVLHTIDTTGPGGAETIFIGLVKGLSQYHERTVVAINGTGWVCDTLQKNGFRPIFLQSKGGFNYAYLNQIVRLIWREEIDIIYAHLFGAGLYCVLAGIITRITVVPIIHGFVDAEARERFMPFKRWVINHGAKRIVFVSRRLREYFVQAYGFSNAKAITIHNGIDTKVFYPERDYRIRSELGLGPEHILIGAVGNIRPAKGYDIFLRAARRIHDRHPESRFLVAGEGSGQLWDALINKRNELGLEECFFFLGFREHTPMVLNNLDIFVLSSVTEGFSISTIEAMACGLPVVVTRSGGPEEIVRDNQTGVIVNCNEAEIANAVERLIRDPGLREAFSIKGLRSVLENFSLNTMIEKYRSIYP